MGVYLSEPSTEKNYKAGDGKKYAYASAEMQGLSPHIQDGGRRWRTHASTI